MLPCFPHPTEEEPQEEPPAASPTVGGTKPVPSFLKTVPNPSFAQVVWKSSINPEDESSPGAPKQMGEQQG